MIRMLDIIFSFFGLIVFSPIFVVLLLVGFWDTRSPIFTQRRVGKNQKPFTLIKFRTMRTETDSLATHLVDSSAVTPWGKILRRSKLDEFPQLWNVLKGEMSLVGARPCLPSQHELIKRRQELGVFALRPGITGLAQVQRIDMSTTELLAKTDAEMLKNLSLWHYFRYIYLTILGKGSGDRIKDT